MTTDRSKIAKGVPRNRYLINVDDVKDKKRVLYYDSKAKAESAFKISGFYGNNYFDEKKGKYAKFPLEAVEVEIKIKEI